MARITQKICRLGCHALSAMVVATATLSSAWAARDFTPQAGTWIISEELDGKPGRGLAIDVQGNTFFMQVFGYEKNGDATFYTATGQMDGNTVTAPLMRYQDGRSFGGDARDAVEDGSPGAVTVSFANGMQGTVQFPGEQAVAIQRFQMMSADFAAQYLDKGDWRSFLVTTLDSDKQSKIFSQLVISKPASSGWRLSIAGYALACARVSGADALNCTNPDAPDEMTPSVRAVNLRIANVDVYGTLDMLEQGVLHRYALQGIAVTGGGGASILGCVAFDDVYVGAVRNCNQNLAPSSGTWVVRDELLGKPGRGLAIDVQNRMALAQIFNYLPNGAPTFHMGSGEYRGIGSDFALNRYQGGRFLGGPAAQAQLADAVGSVRLRFQGRVNGFVQFSNEPEKEVVRLNLEPTDGVSQGLLGQWLMRFSKPDVSESATKQVTLTRVVEDAVISDDGAVVCTRKVPSYQALVDCRWSRGDGMWEAHFAQEPNNRNQFALQLKDRHGNLLGLGDVPLD